VTKSAIANNTIISEEVDEPPSKNVNTHSTTDEEPPGKSFFVHGNNSLYNHVPASDWNDWKWHFRNRITSIDELARLISLSAEEQAQLKLVTAKYPISITPYYLSLVNLADPNDPVRRQSVPCIEEITMGILGMEDPLEEKRDSVVPGLVHRYPDRVLMVLTDICPMFCRHCTRKREWHHGGWVRTNEQIEPMLDYLRKHEEVRDVIISGGDPLTLSTERLESIILRIRQIAHIDIIRIGTRFPVVLPQRVDAELCDMLSKYGPIWLNTHFNHYQEITPEAAQACDRLLRAGIPVNNQCVLMRGINDEVDIQKKLCQGLLKIKVRPYYLFQCDEVQGTEHLRTPVETGLKIIQGLRGHTSGLAVPHFVIDLPEGGGKVSLQPDYVLAKTGSEMIIRNYNGHIFRYRNPGAEQLEMKDIIAAAETAPVKQPVKVGIRAGVKDAGRFSVRP